MRVISKKILIDFWTKHPDSKEQLKAWNAEISNDNCETPNEIKEKYKSASIINKKRVVFNIKGNKYRLIVDIEYRIQIVFIVWLGSHKEYDKINVKEIRYDKTN